MSEQADNAEAGTVLSQNPGPNTAGHENDVVQITVSTGPEPVKLDDYSGQSADAAQAALSKQNLKVRINKQPSDTVAENTVISQSPAKGTKVDPQSTVTLTVSSGAEQDDVPNVAGYTISTAAQTLSSAGLRTSYPDYADASDIVASTDPAAGTKVAKGTTVVLTPQATTTTSTTSSTLLSTTSTSKKKDNGNGNGNRS